MCIYVLCVRITATAGVLGYKEVNSFSLEVIVSPPVRSLDLKPNCNNEVRKGRAKRQTFVLVLFL